MASLHPLPQDNKAYRFPVSVKGIVYHNGKVVLLKNERDEWELPGGKLELGAVFAPMLIGIALWRSRAVPLWAAFLILISRPLVFLYRC